MSSAQAILRPNSLLSTYLQKQFVRNERPPETDARRITAYIANILGVGVGYTGTITFVKEALAFPNKTLGIISAVGCVADFGSFFAEGLLALSERALRPVHEEERALNRNFQSTVTSVVICSLAIFTGIYAQFGLVEASVENFDKSIAMWIGFYSMFATSGPLINGMLDTFDFLSVQIKETAVRCRTKNRALQALLRVKRMMIQNFKANVAYNLSLSAEGKQLSLINHNGTRTINDTSQVITNKTLSSSLFILNHFPEASLKQRNCCVISTKYIVYSVCALLSLSFLYAQGYLGYLSSGDVYDAKSLIVISSLIAIAPWIYKAFTSPGYSVNALINEVLSLFGFGVPTTFVEQFHPKLSKFIDLLAIFLTLLTYPQSDTLVKECCYKSNTLKDDILISAHLLTLMSFFFYAIKTLLEKSVIFAGRRGSNENLRQAILLKEKSDEAINVLEHLSLSDLEEFLRTNGFEAADLNNILGDAKSSEDVLELIKKLYPHNLDT